LVAIISQEFSVTGFLCETVSEVLMLTGQLLSDDWRVFEG